MVGMSHCFSTETEKLQFSGNFDGFLVYGWSVCVKVAPGGVELRPRRSQKLRGSLELLNGSLRAREKVWIMISRLRHFLSSLVVFWSSVGAFAG